jgi:hypothetical protein
MADIEKWTRYYSGEEPPPWESVDPHKGLLTYLKDPRAVKITKDTRIMIPGAGNDPSIVHFSKTSEHTIPIDVTPLSRERFEKLHQTNPDYHPEHISYLIADLLDESDREEFTSEDREIHTQTLNDHIHANAKTVNHNKYRQDKEKSLSYEFKTCGYIYQIIARALKTHIKEDRIQDILYEDKDNVVSEGLLDFIFDLQCFHVIRVSLPDLQAQDKLINIYYKLLKPGAHIMVVVGAHFQDGDAQVMEQYNNSQRSLFASSTIESASKGGKIDANDALNNNINATTNTSGPPKLYRNELVTPFTDRGFDLLYCRLTNFNATPSYAQMQKPDDLTYSKDQKGDGRTHGRKVRGQPPLAWEAVFRKPSYDQVLKEMRL